MPAQASTQGQHRERPLGPPLSRLSGNPDSDPQVSYSVVPAQAGTQGFQSLALGPAFRGGECVREDALSARWKSVPEPVAGSVIEGNCVAVRRGGEQPEVNRQSVG
jgi:hypothetical protein